MTSSVECCLLLHCLNYKATLTNTQKITKVGHIDTENLKGGHIESKIEGKNLYVPQVLCARGSMCPWLYVPAILGHIEPWAHRTPGT